MNIVHISGRRGRIKPLALVSDIDFKKSKKPPETGAKSSESGADEKTQTVSNMQVNLVIFF